MQRGSGDVVAERQHLFGIANPYRHRAVSIRAKRFGGDHQIEFFRQRMGVFNFHLITQLRVGPASPGFRAGDTAELFNLFRGSGYVKDKAVRLVTNVVVDDFQHIDVTLITRRIDNRIVKRRFTLPVWFINVLNSLLPAQLPLRDTPVGRKRQRLRPELAHFVAAVDPDEIIAWGEIGQLESQRRGIFAFRQRFDTVIRNAQQQRQAEMTAGEGNHIFILVDGEFLHLFREVPQANDIWLPREDFLLHVEENFRQRLPGQRTAAKSDKVIPAQNIQHGCAVIHRIAFCGNHFLLGPIAAQHEEQVAAILFVQFIPRGIFHRQMVRRDDDHRVFKVRRGFDFLD